jgi:hypothetical protein
MPHHFPAPWYVDEQEESFVVNRNTSPEKRPDASRWPLSLPTLLTGGS